MTPLQTPTLDPTLDPAPAQDVDILLNALIATLRDLGKLSAHTPPNQIAKWATQLEGLRSLLSAERLTTAFYLEDLKQRILQLQQQTPQAERAAPLLAEKQGAPTGASGTVRATPLHEFHTTRGHVALPAALTTTVVEHAGASVAADVRESLRTLAAAMQASYERPGHVGVDVVEVRVAHLRNWVHLIHNTIAVLREAPPSAWLRDFYEHAVYISPESQRVFDIVHRLCQALDHQKPLQVDTTQSVRAQAAEWLRIYDASGQASCLAVVPAEVLRALLLDV